MNPSRAKVYQLADMSRAFNYRALAKPTEALKNAFDAFAMADARTVVRAVTGRLHNTAAFEDKGVAWTNKSLNALTRLPWWQFGLR